MLADLRNAKTHSNFGMQANSLYTSIYHLCWALQKQWGDYFHCRQWFKLSSACLVRGGKERKNWRLTNTAHTKKKNLNDKCTGLLFFFHFWRIIFIKLSDFCEHYLEAGTKCVSSNCIWRKPGKKNPKNEKHLASLLVWLKQSLSHSGGILIHFILNVHWPRNILSIRKLKIKLSFQGA